MDHDAFEPLLGNGRMPLIAVVDDDPDILELVSVNLKKAGMKVRPFPDAEPFYRFLHQDTPDLVILDLMLPDADGIDVCRSLRRRAPLRGAGDHAHGPGGRSGQGARTRNGRR